ncbi:unnamed protein product [Toxocara canis]|uniref:DUF222 domain-containing protein n=1 Tax=Toxocara canis TaxID=6265 RepID=A0A183U517_TOXCA|nr:unnamed protein product [Toxocara canis]
MDAPTVTSDRVVCTHTMLSFAAGAAQRRSDHQREQRCEHGADRRLSVMPSTTTRTRRILSDAEKRAIGDLRTVVPSLETISDGYITRYPSQRELIC